MTKALYAGRFDPVTNGHLDSARRAAALFDGLIIGVERSGNRGDLGPKTLFDTDERVQLFREAIRDCHNVEVLAYSGLTVEFARKLGASVLIRSIRGNTEFDNVFDQALMNREMAPEIESVYLIARLESPFISGTLIRQVEMLGYDVSGLVPSSVAEALKRKFA